MKYSKKILLVHPPWIVKSDSNLIKNVHGCTPSVGLLSIAAVLEKEGHVVQYLDSSAEGLYVNSFHNIAKKLISKNFMPDFIGLTATTAIIENTYSICQILKEYFPNSKIVIGGIHATILPEEALTYSDYVVIGEGEITFKELVNGVRPEKILGLGYHSKKGIKINDPRPAITDLDSLPMPAYHLLDFSKYRPAVGNSKRFPAITVLTSRNCSYNCKFCYHYSNKVAFRSAENIIKEVKLLTRKYGIKEIHFYDDNFLLNKENVIRFCKLLEQEKIDITWTCLTRVDTIVKNGKVSLEYLKLLKKSGLWRLLFGIETADIGLMKRISKIIDLDDARKAINACRKVGIQSFCTYMLGLPGETEKTCSKTINFALSLDSDMAHFNLLTPYPGTPIFDWAKAHGLFLPRKRWENYSISDRVIRLPTISNKRLDYYYRLANRKFYLRPKTIFRRLKNLTSLSALKQEIQGLRALIRL
jgi:radical SAM superfamily enzyme YgiQ (UPF0313 family)